MHKKKRKSNLQTDFLAKTYLAICYSANSDSFVVLSFVCQILFFSCELQTYPVLLSFRISSFAINRCSVFVFAFGISAVSSLVLLCEIFYNAVAKLNVNHLVECCTFIADLLSSFDLSFPCTFWVLSEPGMQKLGRSLLAVHACDSARLPMRVLCLLKQPRRGHICK